MSSKETSKVRRAASCQRTKLWPAARPAFKIRKNAAEKTRGKLENPQKKQWQKKWYFSLVLSGFKKTKKNENSFVKMDTHPSFTQYHEIP